MTWPVEIKSVDQLHGTSHSQLNTDRLTRQIRTMKIVLLLALVVVGVTAHPHKRCPMYLIQFCGSDGKTYTSNPCFIQSQMRADGLLGYEDFRSLHYGPCTGTELTGEQSTEPSPPASTATPTDNNSALTGRKRAQCNTFCPMFMIQFCGSDGKTYTSNECFIKSRMCTEGLLGYEDFHTLHMGACKGTELTADKSSTAAPASTIAELNNENDGLGQA